MALSSFIGLRSEFKVISRGKPCFNWLEEALGWAEGFHKYT